MFHVEVTPRWRQCVRRGRGWLEPRTQGRGQGGWWVLGQRPLEAPHIVWGLQELAKGLLR